jgi:hypothetical protein
MKHLWTLVVTLRHPLHINGHVKKVRNVRLETHVPILRVFGIHGDDARVATHTRGREKRCNHGIRALRNVRIHARSHSTRIHDSRRTTRGGVGNTPVHPSNNRDKLFE